MTRPYSRPSCRSGRRSSVEWPPGEEITSRKSGAAARRLCGRLTTGGGPPQFRAEQQVVQRAVQFGGQRVQDAHRRYRDSPLDLRDEAGRTSDPASQLTHGQLPFIAGQAQPGPEPRFRIEASRHGVNVHCTLLTANLDSPTARGIGWLVPRAEELPWPYLHFPSPPRPAGCTSTSRRGSTSAVCGPTGWTAPDKPWKMPGWARCWCSTTTTSGT